MRPFKPWVLAAVARARPGLILFPSGILLGVATNIFSTLAVTDPLRHRSELATSSALLLICSAILFLIASLRESAEEAWRNGGALPGQLQDYLELSSGRLCLLTIGALVTFITALVVLILS